MLHCALEATLKPKRFSSRRKLLYEMCSLCKCTGRLSKHAVRQQQSFCHQMCCVCVEQRTICQWTSGADVRDLLKPSVCHQKSTEVQQLTPFIHSFIHFWHAPLWVCSAKRRHQSPEWTVLSHISWCRTMMSTEAIDDWQQLGCMHTDTCTSSCPITSYWYEWNSYEWSVHGHSYKHKHL